MSKDTRNYYEHELRQIDFNGGRPARIILIGSEGRTTRTLDINKESAVALIHKLTAFLIAPERANPQPTRARLHVCYSIGRDKNGNKLLRVKTSGRGGFSIQTNGNLPQTHRDGVTSATDAEVCAYVRRHGSERRKRVLDIQ